MIEGKKILAVVPARSGSKGIPHKNMRPLGGKSLIAHAGDCLSSLKWVDRKIISTDSESYAEEGRRHGLESPFLRPPELSDDKSPAIDTMVHALKQCEAESGERYDLVALVEPTSPFRRPSDIEFACLGLIRGGYDSAVSVSQADTKSHPLKMLTVESDRLGFHDPKGKEITTRQQLDTLYVRNGACYLVTRETLLERRRVITDNTFACIISRRMVNIDEPIDLEWAEFLLARKGAAPGV
jgi:CMP-N-acetylneuraminic acid synthetase